VKKKSWARGLRSKKPFEDFQCRLQLQQAWLGEAQNTPGEYGQGYRRGGLKERWTILNQPNNTGKRSRKKKREILRPRVITAILQQPLQEGWANGKKVPMAD